MTWTHRTFTVSHGRDGFFLRVTDEWWLATAAEWIAETALAALGHPCCGRGPLGRIPTLGLVWHRVLNLRACMPHRDRAVIGLPLSEKQAARIAPAFVEEMRHLDNE